MRIVRITIQAIRVFPLPSHLALARVQSLPFSMPHKPVCNSQDGLFVEHRGRSPHNKRMFAGPLPASGLIVLCTRSL